MKVTFVVANYAPSLGGAQIYVQRIAEGLVARHGCQVEVVTTDAIRRPSTPDAGKIPEPFEVVNGVRVHRLPVARRTHSALRLLRRVGRRLGLVRTTRRTPLEVGPIGVRFLRTAAVAGRRSDAVVAVTAPSLTSSGAELATRHTSAAYVAVPLLHLTQEPLGHRSLRSLARADGCVALTSYERDWLVERGLRPDRVAVLPPGCDPAAYPDLDPRTARAELGLPDSPTVGYVGRLAVYKGVPTLLEAFRRVWSLRPDTTLLLAGNNAGWAEFDEIVERIQPVAAGRLVIRPGFSDKERGLLLAACDVVAFPSSEESFGMVTIEAWCARRPVIAADIPVVRELISAGADGELVPVGDELALAEAVEALLADPAKRARLGAAGRARAESEFGWGEIIDRWNDHVVASVAQRRGANSGLAGSRR